MGIKKYFVFSLLVFLLAAGLRVFYINQKQGFHVDEIFSLETIVGKRIESDYFIKNANNVYLGKDIKNYYFHTPRHSLKEDLIKLRKDNNADDAHPSLYYSLLRIAYQFSQFSPQGFINLGCGLNLIFFAFSFFIMRKILIRLFGDNKLVPIGLGAAFLNTGTISMTLFIRPYELQMLAFVLISYVYLVYKDKLKNNLNILSIKDVCILSVSLAFTFLSGYYLVLYVGFLGLILLWHAAKNFKNIGALTISVMLSVFLSVFIYHGYFLMLHGQRFESVNFSGFFDEIVFYIINFVSYFCNLNKFLFYTMIIITLACSIPFLKNKEKAREKSLVIIAFIWSFIVAMISPFSIIRYIAPAFPVLSVALVYVIQKIKLDKQNIFISLVFVIYIIYGIFPLKNESSDTLIFYKNNSSVLPFAARIENLFVSELPKTDKNLPVLIKGHDWYAPLYIISYLDDDKQYLIDSVEGREVEITNHPFKNYYLYLDSSVNQVSFDKNHVELKPLGNLLRYKCFEVTTK